MKRIHAKALLSYHCLWSINQNASRLNMAGKKRAAKKSPPSQIRIVAGTWRGRKIPVLDSDGLRPTGDRVRETLFNWLQLDIPGSHCLDLFAGSGALGLEAASRGAASVQLVESSASVAAQLKRTMSDLGASDSVSLWVETAQQFLENSTSTFDVVFVDPPFDKELHRVVLQALVDGCLNADALIYVECPTAQRDHVLDLPEGLQVAKEKRFGEVSAILLSYQ